MALSSTSSPSSDARAVAAHALGAIVRRGRTLDWALAAAPGLDAISPRDAAFTRLLLLTTLRRLGQIDAFLAGLMDRPLPARRGPVQDVLRLGIAQLAFLETPAHAAVASTVALAARAAARALPGTCQRSAASGLPRAQRDRRASTRPRLNTPDWLWQSWTQAYGEASLPGHRRSPPQGAAARPLAVRRYGGPGRSTLRRTRRRAPARRHAATAGRRRGDAAGWLRGG